MANVVLLPKTEPNAIEFVKAAMRDWGLDPSQEIDLSDPMTRLVLAIVITTIENGRDVYSYTQFVKGCAMSLGMDPDQLAQMLNPTGIAIENQTGFRSPATGYVSPTSPQIKQGGSSLSPVALSGYIQLGVATTLASSGWSLGGVTGTPLAAVLPGGQNYSVTPGVAGSGIVGTYQGTMYIPGSSPPANGTGYIPLTQDALVKLPPALQNDKDFINAVNTVASDQNMAANDLIAIYKLETGGTYSTTITNSIGATGLFQVIPSTAQGLGYTTAEVRSMTPAQQVMLHGEFLSQTPLENVPNPTRADAYLANFYPYAVGKNDNFVIGSQNGTAAQIAAANPGLVDPNLGVVTVASVKAALSRNTASIPYATENSRPANVEGTLSGGTNTTVNPNTGNEIANTNNNGTAPAGNTPAGGTQQYPTANFREDWAVANGYTVRTDIRNTDGTKLVGYEFTNPATGEKVTAYPDGSIFNSETGKQLDTSLPQIPQAALDNGYNKIIQVNPDGSYVIGPGEPTRVIPGVDGKPSSQIEATNLLNKDPENYLVIRDGAVVKAGPSATNWDGKNNLEDTMQTDGWKNAIDPVNAYKDPSWNATTPGNNTLGTAANTEGTRLIPGVPGVPNSQIEASNLPPIGGGPQGSISYAGATAAQSFNDQTVSAQQTALDTYRNQRIEEVGQLKNEIQSSQELLDSVNEQRASLTDTLDKINTTGSPGPGYERAVNTYNDNINATRGEIQNELATKSALETQLGEGRGYFTPEQVADYQSRIAASDSRLTALNAVMQNDQKALNTLLDQKDFAIQTNRRVLEDKLAELDPVAKNLETTIAEKQIQVDTKTAEITTATDSYNSLETSRQTLSLVNENAAIKERVDDLSARIDKLEEQQTDNQIRLGERDPAIQNQIDSLKQDLYSNQNQYAENQRTISNNIANTSDNLAPPDLVQVKTIETQSVNTAQVISETDRNNIYKAYDEGIGDYKYYKNGVEVQSNGELPTTPYQPSASGATQTPQTTEQVIRDTSVPSGTVEEAKLRSEGDPASYYKHTDDNGTTTYWQNGQEISPRTGVGVDTPQTALDRELQTRSEMPTDVPLPPPRPAELRQQTNLTGVTTVERESVDQAKADSAADPESIYRATDSEGNTKYYAGGQEFKEEPISTGGTTSPSGQTSNESGASPGPGGGAPGAAPQAATSAAGMAKGC